MWLKDLVEMGKWHKSVETLIDANILAQVANVLQLLRTHKLKKPLKIRGWLYHMENGRIHELEVHEIRPRAQLEECNGDLRFSCRSG